MKNKIMAGVSISIALTSRGWSENRTWEKARQRSAGVMDSLVGTWNRCGEHGLVLPGSIIDNSYTKTFRSRSNLTGQDAPPARSRYQVERIRPTFDHNEEKNRIETIDSPRFRGRASSDPRRAGYTARAGRAKLDQLTDTESVRPPGSTVTLSPEEAALR